jgi:hypothetical protein
MNGSVTCNQTMGNLERTFSKLDFKVCPFIIFVSYLMLQLFAAVAVVVVG